MILRFELFVSFPFFTDGSRNRRHLGSERETLARVWTGKGGNLEGKNSGGVWEEIAFYRRNHDGSTYLMMRLIVVAHTNQLKIIVGPSIIIDKGNLQIKSNPHPTFFIMGQATSTRTQ